MHVTYMKRTLELASKGCGHVNPNPKVGAVVVKNNMIIAEGWHHFYGGAHAEVDAISKINEDTKDCTLYVNLEPCSHYGKTPPCADLIIESGIKKVVIAMRDPNPLVSGRGIKKLMDAGIEVVENILEAEAKELNKFFIKHITDEMPYVVLKTAMTLDGKIATSTGDSKWITSPKSREYVHKLRHEMKGIMVGIGTVLADDPMLNVRVGEINPSHPIRIVADSNCRIPLNSALVESAKIIPLIVGISENLVSEKVQLLKDKGVKVIRVPIVDKRLNLTHFLKELSKLSIDSVLLEGGGNLNWSMLNNRLVDQVQAFIAPKIIGGTHAITPIEGEGFKNMKDAIQLKNMTYQEIGKDLLIKADID